MQIAGALDTASAGFSRPRARVYNRAHNAIYTCESTINMVMGINLLSPLFSCENLQKETL